MNSIFIVTNSLTGGGAERSMNILANSLHAKNWGVTLVPINAGQLDSVKVDCEIVNLDRVWNSGLADLIRTAIKFRRLVLTIRPDVIVLNCDLPEFLGILLPWSQRVVVVEHSPRPFQSRIAIGRLVRLIERFRKVQFVVVSPNLPIWSIKQAAGVHIPNPVDVSSLRDLNLYRLSTKVPISRLIFIGRLSPEKDPELFFEVAKHSKLPALAIGDGPMFQELQGRYCNLADFVGQSPDPWSYVNRGDLVLVTSNYEGDGLVVTEGIIKGIPLLIRDNCDLRRFNLDEMNYARDLSAFVNRISAGKSIGDFLVSKAIRSRISSQRNIETISASWEELLRDILKPH